MLRGIVESPLTPWDAAFLEMLLEGRLARGGYFRRQEEKDGIAGLLDWVKPEKLVFQDDYQSALESMASVQTEFELKGIQSGTLRKASAVYGQDRRLGSLGALCKGLHGGGVPDVRSLHDGTRGTVFNPYIRGRRVITRGSGISHGHTDWPVDFVSKPGVASVSPKTLGYRTNLEGGGTGVSCRGKLKVGLPGESCILFLKGP